MDFALPGDHRIKLKECERKGKYLNLSRELKNQWSMKVIIIPIVIDAFNTVTKGLLTGLEDLEFGGWVETIQTTALLRTARILRKVLETWSDLPSQTLVKNYQLKLMWNGKSQGHVGIHGFWDKTNHVHPRKTRSWNEKMPRTSKYTRINDYGGDSPDP